MKTPHIFNIIILSAFAVLLMSACKTKKLADKPVAAATATTPVTKPVTAQQPVSTQPLDKAPAVVITKPNLNFKRVQFDYNSAVLKTSSIELLDQAAGLIKKYPGYHFSLSGYASSEGTPQHNLILSAERANAVKSYLVNNGIDQADFTTKGYGEADPVASNKTETGRIANRRVEFSLAR